MDASQHAEPGETDRARGSIEDFQQRGQLIGPELADKDVSPRLGMNLPPTEGKGKDFLAVHGCVVTARSPVNLIEAVAVMRSSSGA